MAITSVVFPLIFILVFIFVILFIILAVVCVLVFGGFREFLVVIGLLAGI